MLRAADKRQRLGEPLPYIFGGRSMRAYPNRKPPRILGTDTPPVTPTTWLDASKLSSLTVSADLVTSMTDLTGGGATATANGSLPLVIFPGKKGLTSVFLGGSSEYFAVPGVSMTDITSTLFFVGCAPGAFVNFMTLAGPTASGGIQFLLNASGQIDVHKAGSTALGVQSNANATIAVPFVAGFVASASDVTHYMNGTTETDAHAQSLTGAATLNIGRTGFSTAFPYTGWFGEFLFFDTSLSSGDAGAVSSYLMQKWGVT